MRALAINVAANTNQPGFRGPIHEDGGFEYVPIPEAEPTRERVPTYGDLELDIDTPDDTPVHLDPTFAEYACCDAYTYGDPHGVKARPISDLRAGDRLYFYATLTSHGDHPDAWVTPDWGAYLVGEFTLARDPLTEKPADGEFPWNAHLAREEFDAAVLVEGSSESRLYDTAVPLSGERGIDANRVVTEYSDDSGKGPWWRRPLRFDDEGASALREWVDRDAYPPVR
ncbi:Nmad3 family putative nucleotide modification protein [Salarchaeum japonicum]|uniref:Nucleotide modification associated domain-containing protein n=1 Tax=Salarchaeum japonicum TaxID=555573 RepID=A0AAV3SZL0_9EURY|nr:hypothetical protein [Salarchaeum japonicum]